jgi:3-dehydroquinate dehydratase type I
MAARRSVKAKSRRPRTVGVISSRADLTRAIATRRPPDLFELRLDALASRADEVETLIPKLAAPLIMTARDPREGGTNRLSITERRALFLRFMPHALYVDVELRSAIALRSVIHLARRKKIGRIISFHDLTNTPSIARMCEKARAAKSLGADVFKIATRTDTARQLDRLLRFYDMSILPTAAMGIGKLGRKARLELMRRGSVLNYAHLGNARLAGQLSLGEMQRAFTSCG